MSRRAVNGSSTEKSIQEIGNKEGGASEKQVRLLTSDGHFSLIRALHAADYVTAMNCFCGIMSIFSSMRYCLGSPTDLSNLWAALALMPFGLAFDFMDGKVARWQGKSSLMGQELDSLADLISFGAAPASCAFAMGLRTPVDHLLLTLFVVCGLMRLARFNVTVATLPKDATGKSQYFEGTPIPTSLSISALMAFWASQGWIHDQMPFGSVGVGSFWEFHLATLLFVGHGCLMVSKTIHIPKP